MALTGEKRGRKAGNPALSRINWERQKRHSANSPPFLRAGFCLRSTALGAAVDACRALPVLVRPFPSYKHRAN